MTGVRHGLMGAAATVALGWLTPALAGGAMPLAAHRAVYDLSLVKSSGSTAPTGATGRIVFDFSGSACDGYVMNFRQVTELQPAEGAQRVSDMRSTTFEAGDAGSFRFKSETLVDGHGSESLDGTASKSPDGGLSIKLSKPQPTTLDLDRDIAFPTEQIVRMLQAAHDDQRTLELKLFDGSETGQTVYNTLAVIGRPLTAMPAEKAAQIDALKDVKRWPVTVSYFDTKKPDGPPNYTMSFDLYDNGISGSLRLDYGDFVLKGELTQLDLRPQPACDK